MTRLVLLIVLLLIPQGLSAQISVVVHHAKNSTTSDALDTTGANFLVGHASCAFGSGQTFSDSKGNTWSSLTTRSSSDSSSRLFYSENPTVGTGHTFTAGSCSFGAVAVIAASGVALTSAFDQENGASSSSATSLATGSVTPSQNDALIVSGAGYNHSVALSIDSGFTAQTTPLAFGVAVGGGLAYLIQSTAAAVNPTWDTGGTTSHKSVTIAVFLPSGGGGAPASTGPSVGPWIGGVFVSDEE